jgi:hypothetical protein
MSNLKFKNMVTIIDVVQTKTKDGSPLISLIVMGPMEPKISQATGKVYMSAMRTRIPCTFTMEVARSMIGQTLPGIVKRIECEPYTFTFPGSSKKLTLKHTFAYDPTPISVESVVG